MIEAIYHARPIVLARFMAATGEMKQFWKDRLDQLNSWDGQWNKNISSDRQQDIIEACKEWSR